MQTHIDSTDQSIQDPTSEWRPSKEHSPRLLIAEDDGDMRWALSTFFGRSGYDVHSVGDGDALLEELRPMIHCEPHHWPPDVILTDMRMPGADGLYIIEALRDLGWYTPAIVISGFGDTRIQERVEELRFVEYLEKPLEIEPLTEAVYRAIKSY